MGFLDVRSIHRINGLNNKVLKCSCYVDSLKQAYGFRDEDLFLLSALSSPAAIAIENATLYSNMEQTIEERTKDLVAAKNELLESESRFKAVFNNIISGAIILQVAGGGEKIIVVDLNAAVTTATETDKKYVIGRDVRQFFPDFHEENLFEAVKSVWQGGKPKRVTVKSFQKNQIISWKEYYICKLKNHEILALYADLKETKKAEDREKSLQAQLLISQKMESIGAFAGGTAHNFRNILQAISGNIEYLDMVYSNIPEMKEISKNIYDSVDKGVELINNLLHFSKRGGEYQLITLDLAEVIEKTYEIISRIFDKSIEIELDVEKGLHVKGNHSLLSQVFMNLTSNAKDAMREGGKLLLKANKKKKTVVAQVIDTGHGMDKETLNKIFDPFFSLKDVGEGTGLGLSTTHGIVEQLGGKISARSKPGKGAAFKISFPLVDWEEPVEVERENKFTKGMGAKILIIDDEPLPLNSMARLTRSLGYEVFTIDNPMEAIKNFKKWSPKVVLMDRSMPKMDGITCTKKILKIDPTAKIIIVSGYEDSGPNGIDDSEKSLIKGYLKKPCKLKELSITIKNVLKE